MMKDIQRKLLKEGVKQQQEHLRRLHELKIDEQFLETPEFWQCHRCRKISYDLLNGTYTFDNNFNIDTHLQQLLLKGFYSLFAKYQPSNKSLTRAQVKKKERLQNCWRFLFLNTCHAIRDHQEAISLSLDNTQYKREACYHSRYWNYGDLKQVVRAAVSVGYYKKYKGQQSDVSFITRLKITDKFRQLISSYVLENRTTLPADFTDYDMILAAPLPRPKREPVIIKITDYVYKIPKKSNNDVDAICKRVEKYNEFMGKQEIIINLDLSKQKEFKYLKDLVYSQYGEEVTLIKYNYSNNSNKSQTSQYNYTHTPTNNPVINLHLSNDYNEKYYPNIAFRFIGYFCQRIFTKNMQLGGRFYRIVVQKLSEELRKRITINGEPVVELDFAALHPSLLYSQIGIQPPNDIYVYDKGEDTKARTLIKIIALVGFNAGSEKEAINAVRQKYHEKYDVMLRNADIKPAFEIFFDHNPELKQFLGKGVGTKLQYIDSQIMDTILTKLRKENIPAIPIHDSCVVPASAGSVVHDVMVSAYQKITKTDHIPFITQ